VSACGDAQHAPDPGEAYRQPLLPSDRNLIERCLNGDASAFDGIVLRYQDALFLIMSGEASEIVPHTKAAQRLVRRGKLRSTHVRVDWIDYNAQVPAGLFDTTIPPGWTVVHKDR